MIYIGITIPTLIMIYHIYNIYQQEHYDYSKLIKTYPKLYLTKIYMYILYIMFILVIFNFKYIKYIILILGLLSIITIPKYIIKLKITNRILRLILTTIIIYTTILIHIYSDILLMIMIILYPFILYIINLINKPVELLINNYYIFKAKQKLKQNKNLIKIAITGSYGKTTTKNILNELLQDTFITLSTPKSYNTIMGITKVINRTLTQNTEILIVEMGANHQNEIKKMKELINPDISIITEIGPQHLSTFKSIANILKTKLEIINFKIKDSITIINSDNIYLNNLQLLNKTLYKVGLSKNSNIYATEIKTTNNITTFKIIDKINNTNLNISTPLLGIHNVNNILLAYTVSKHLKINQKEIIKKLEQLTITPHRLEYKKQNNINIYDDSYNSNIQGFKNAIKVLRETNTKKIIITPGIVDAGAEEEKLNKEIAQIINNSNIDDIYLIDNKVTKYYEQTLNKYKVFNSFNDAYKYLIKTYTLEEVSVLIENDLPDNYFER